MDITRAKGRTAACPRHFIDITRAKGRPVKGHLLGHHACEGALRPCRRQVLTPNVTTLHNKMASHFRQLHCR